MKILHIDMNTLYANKIPLHFHMFVCLGGFFLSHSRLLNSYGDITFTGEGVQILTFARHSWSLSSKCDLACHTYCDMGHPFTCMWSSPMTHDTHIYCRAFGLGLYVGRDRDQDKLC